MSAVFLTPIELRARGFDALVQALGWVNAVRFIQQYEPSQFNYVEERDAILPDWNAQEIVQQLKKPKK